MTARIADTFGEAIGMSRRDIRGLARKLSAADIDRLGRENRKIFSMIANREYLWPKPQWNTNYRKMDSQERYELLRKDIFIYLVRSAIPPHTSKADRFSRGIESENDSEAENYVKKVVLTREAAMDMIKHGEVNCQHFIDIILPGIWPFTDKRSRNARVVQAVGDILKGLERITRNALVSGFPEWPNKIIFRKYVRLEYFDDTSHTGVYLQDGARRRIFKKREDFHKFLDDEKEKKKTKREKISNPVRPMLEKVTRNGPTQSFNGIEAEEFKERFALRGGEFGTWLSQEDRRQSLEHAASAFSDLALILGMDEKEIGKNSLGFSFGARGLGGFRAACAHYEPDFNVINLTKWHGAGSLAHEWAHFIDFKILRPAGCGSDAMRWLKGYAVEATGMELVKLRKEDLRWAEKEIISAAKIQNFWLSMEIREEFDSIYHWMEYKDYFTYIAEKILPPDEAEKLFDYMVKHVETATYYLDSAYYANAKLLDRRRWRPYWSTPHELFARAFEKYVANELAKRGFHNDYLLTLYEHDIPPYPVGEDMIFFEEKIRKIVNDCLRGNVGLNKIKGKDINESA